ncbi:MAG TPA: succinyldiaminopimelate transaminase [Burkholderiales bacterium]|nr:succinyldiaminopimelate transaminase [Burkholderiales bacterium]
MRAGTVNPRLQSLQPYPFEKLRSLFEGVKPNPGLAHISLGIGEPRHPTPELIKRALSENLAKLATYPPTAGGDALRQAIAEWLVRRYRLRSIDWKTEVLPVNGSREALFAFAQTVVDPRGDAVVVCPNPFYQIYEGAALLAGARPHYVNTTADRGFAADYASIPQEVWRRTQLLYVCSPGNPTGKVLSLAEWREIFVLADRHGFIVASDECYSEIYFDEAAPPLGALQAAAQLGRGFERLVMFSSLSKRSNVPGMRSGFVAGDAAVLKAFLLYRTYHGGAMNPAIQEASVAAWNDEYHVRENRRKYAEKFARVTPIVQTAVEVEHPDAGFYLWVRTPIEDTEFARRLYAEQHLTVLPGSFLARDSGGINPGAGYVRMALVADIGECLEAARRIVEFAKTL